MSKALRAIIFAIALFVAVIISHLARADEIPGFVDKFRVRSLVSNALAEWSANPTGPACGSRACCPDLGANAACTDPGVPSQWCTGPGEGTGHRKACRAFARLVDGDLGRAAAKIEPLLKLQPGWECSTTIADYASGRHETVCTGVPPVPIESISRIAAGVAQRQRRE